MCANPYRGEVALTINGQPEILALTLGAIAMLQKRVGAETIGDLINRFGQNQYDAGDIIAVLEAGYYGANQALIDMKSASIEGGVAAAARAAIELLMLGFHGYEAAT